MNFIQTVIKRPVSAVVIMLGIVVFGVMSLLSMPQELTPEMNMPIMLVSTVYAGAGPEDVEKLVSTEIEGAVSALSGIKNVSSYSMDNASIVMMQYEYGTNMDIAYTDVKEKLDGIANDLPSGAQKPIVMEMDMNAMDTMTLSIRSASGDNLLGYIDEEIIPEFEKLSTVADVGVSGGREEYVRVELLEDSLQQYGININTVINSVSTADFSIPSGTADYGSQSLAVRSSVEYKTIRALENIPIPLGNGNIIRLADVANIYGTVKDAESISRYNSEDNISVGIQKRQSASAVDVSKQVLKVVDDLNNNSSGIHIDVVYDGSEQIQSSISSVGTTLILSIFLSMLVLYIFLGDIKASLIVGSSMPISLLVAFILMSMMGFTINIVTMSALVLGVGMMVDNSIVVLDSCFKYNTKDSTFQESAIAGTKFVISSIVGSTVTTVVVFFPLAVIQGMSGQMFKPLGFTIIFALVASLASAMTLVPLFFVQFQPRERRKAPAALLLKKTQRAYGNLLKKLLHKKRSVVIVSVAMMVVAVFLGTQLNFELMPNIDEGTISISLDTRPGLQLEKVDALVIGVEEMVAAHPDVDHYAISAGGSGISAMMNSGAATVTVYLKDKPKMSTEEVIEQWRQDTKNLMDCDVTISSSSQTASFGGDSIDVSLQGNDLDVLRDYVSEIEAVFKAHPDIITVTSNVADPNPQAEIVVDPMKAAAVNLTPMQVASNVRMALTGTETVNIRQDNQDYAIWVEYPQGKYKTVSDLSNMIMVTATGTSVALSDISSIQFTDSPQTIQRSNSQYIVTITGTPTIEAKYTAESDITASVAALTFPQGVALAESTMQEMMNDEFASLGMAIAVAVLLVFMVMAIQFESVKHSLMVMICIPFSMIGSFILMFAAGTTISMTSLLGFLILVGTVVNNGILFVDSTNQYRASMDIETALIYTGRNRLRPILMTTLTTVLSMMPLALGIGSGAEMMQGLGVVVIGGLTVSTLLTLLLLPTFYLIIEGNSDKKNKRKEKKAEKQAKKSEAAEKEYSYGN